MSIVLLDLREGGQNAVSKDLVTLESLNVPDPRDGSMQDHPQELLLYAAKGSPNGTGLYQGQSNVNFSVVDSLGDHLSQPRIWEHHVQFLPLVRMNPIELSVTLSRNPR